MMAKGHRGKGIRDLFARGRGTCPSCGASGIKLLYELESEGQKVNVCKPCRAAIKRGKKIIPIKAAAADKETLA